MDLYPNKKSECLTLEFENPKRLKQSHLQYGNLLKVQRRTKPKQRQFKSQPLNTQFLSNSSKCISFSQMRLDYGQSHSSFSLCPICGMTYSQTNSDDIRSHNLYHSFDSCPPSLFYIKYANEDTVVLNSNVKIIRIKSCSANHLIIRAKHLWTYLQNEHGFVKTEFDFGSTSMQLYIFILRPKNMIVGCCFAEKIKSAYQWNDLIEDNLMNSEHHYPAMIGINRIWIHQLHRRCNTATELLNTIRDNFYSHLIIPKIHLAFSEPSPDGISFALSYFGINNFLVYKL